MKEDDLLGWLIHQKRHSEIPEVTDEMKDKLIESTKYLAVIFCKFRKIFFSIFGPFLKTFSFFLVSLTQTTKTINKTSEF